MAISTTSLHTLLLSIVLIVVGPCVSAAQQDDTMATTDTQSSSVRYAITPKLGPLGVNTTESFVLHDDARDKDLPLLVRYPTPTAEAPGPFPMIVFSHGAGGSNNAFAKLSIYLASHGYVVVHPTHSDSLALRRKLGQKNKGIIRNVDLNDRTADVRFILDSIDELEQHMGRANMIDRTRFGMAGHSAGAMTTQALAGLKFFSGLFLKKSKSDPETRFKAFAVISGQGTARRPLTNKSWTDIHVPWLVITGSKDTIPVSSETPQTRQEPYLYAPADDTKYLVFIEGATHSSYQGKSRFGRLIEGKPPENIDWIADITNESVLAFFDAYVKDNPDAKAWLDAGSLENLAGGSLRFEHK